MNKRLKEEAKTKQWEEDQRLMAQYAAMLEKQERTRKEQLERLKAVQARQAADAASRPEAKTWIDPALIDKYLRWGAGVGAGRGSWGGWLAGKAGKAAAGCCMWRHHYWLLCSAMVRPPSWLSASMSPVHAACEANRPTQPHQPLCPELSTDSMHASCTTDSATLLHAAPLAHN